MRLARFHVSDAAPGAEVHLAEASAHHAKDVLRLRPGDPVRVFDGRGNEYEAVIERVSRRGVEVHVTSGTTPRPESPLQLHLAISPLKGDLMELVIQKATELGVAAIHPVVMARTDAAARPALEGTRAERWEKVAASAAEQCGRALVPQIAATTRLADFVADASGARILCLAQEAAPAMASIEAPAAPVATVLVGPAGGIDPSEVDLLTARGYTVASLGPRILRAETAALTVVVMAQMLWGDLRR